MKLEYLGYGLLVSTVVITLSFMGVSVPAFHAGFGMLLGVLACIMLIAGLVGFLIVAQDRGYYVSRLDIFKSFTPTIIAVVGIGCLIGIGVFIALKP